MSLLLILSFCLIILDALFIGSALSGGYAPYAGTGAFLIYLLAIFQPFLSEYNSLHLGLSKITRTFKFGNQKSEPAPGNIEIILPAQHNVRTPKKEFGERNRPVRLIIVFLVLASALLGWDAFNFYIFEEGLKTDSGPITNF